MPRSRSRTWSAWRDRRSSSATWMRGWLIRVSGRWRSRWRGLARREPSPRDRRVKNLVLTTEGLAAKEQMMQELALRMPWCYALDEQERHVFLALIEKMLAAGPEQADTPVL